MRSGKQHAVLMNIFNDRSNSYKTAIKARRGGAGERSIEISGNGK